MKRYDLDVTPGLFTWMEPVVSNPGLNRRYSQDEVVDLLIGFHESRLEQLRSITNSKSFRDAMNTHFMEIPITDG